MDGGTALTYFFAQVMRLFNIESPFFGLTFWQIAVGLFVCELGIGLVADFIIGLFDTSAPGAQEKFKAEYHNSVWRNRYKRYYDIK